MIRQEEHPCDMCSKPFMRPYQNNKETSRKFCSRDCRAKSYKDNWNVVKNCHTCDEPYNTTARNSKCCSDNCRPTLNRYNSIYTVLERDDFKCCYCGKTTYEDGIKLHVDHVVPSTSGGLDEVHNLISACSTCNTGKGASKLKDDNLKGILREIQNRNKKSGLKYNTKIRMGR